MNYVRHKTKQPVLAPINPYGKAKEKAQSKIDKEKNLMWLLDKKYTNHDLYIKVKVLTDQNGNITYLPLYRESFSK